MDDTPVTVREHYSTEVHIAHALELYQPELLEGRRLDNWLIIYASEFSMQKHRTKQDTRPYLFILVTFASALSKKPMIALNFGYMSANV